MNAITKKVVTVRMDLDLYGEIKKCSRDDHRSISSEIIQIIIEWFNDRADDPIDPYDLPDSLRFRDRSKDE